VRFLALLLCCLTGVSRGESLAVDDYGNTVRLAAPAARIVSLSPHLTELLYAAGAGARVVGAVDFSDYPREAAALPRVGGDAGIDLEALLALRPDLVVAWPNAGSLRAIDRLAGLGLPVFRSEPREFEHIASTLERLGVLAGTQSEARLAAAGFRRRAAELERRYAGRAKVRVYYQVWDRPLLTVNGDHLISKVMRLCGGENVFAALPLIAPEIDREAVLRADPEVIVTSGAGLDSWKAFPGLAAAASGQLHYIPAALIQRHTPRLLEGAERLCVMLDSVRRTR
jgi:iron complex transport system substrate-binding protein